MAEKDSDAKGGNGLIRCDACPVLCRIRPGRTGACDRYGNEGGKLVRTDALVLAQFSMARARGMIADAPGRRVVTSPESAVLRMKSLLGA